MSNRTKRLMKFDVGDLVMHQHQVGAEPELVVALTDDPDVVVVFAGDRYKRVHAWSRDLLQPATELTRQQATDHTLSEAYARTTSQPHW